MSRGGGVVKNDFAEEGIFLSWYGDLFVSNVESRVLVICWLSMGKFLCLGKRISLDMACSKGKRCS